MMIKCVNCEHLQDDKNVRCEKCGRTVSEKEEILNKKYSKICSTCHSVIAASFKDSCPICHTPFPRGNFLQLTDAEAMGLRLGFGRSR